MQDVIPNMSSQGGLQGIKEEDMREFEQVEEAGVKDAGVQTVFRDSEAQTDPYTPDYRVKEGENPEILTLANLTYGDGLPATFDELQQIE